jgi:hypothetical protein
MATRLAVRHGARLIALYVREYSIAQARWLRSSEEGLVFGKQADTPSQDIEQELDAHPAGLRVERYPFRGRHKLAFESYPRPVGGSPVTTTTSTGGG